MKHRLSPFVKQVTRANSPPAVLLSFPCHGNLQFNRSQPSRLVFYARTMTTKVNPPRDPNTLSNYNNWRTTHTTTNLEISFKEQKLKGTVTLDLKSITEAETKEIILDSSYLDIENVEVDDKRAQWELLPRLEPYGSALKILLDQAVALDHSVAVSVQVATTKECTALQWLTPEQTSNKHRPYMFSQCQAIHARAIFPCQDTPDVKSTFSFNITSPLPVIASGLPSDSNPSDGTTSGGPQTYKFEQPVPIPSYLFALASGDISTTHIGPRSFVASGPDELAACKWELEADTERFLKAAESIVYPYAWGQYNVLVLPPSFPYGGMENPVFTFATPTIISGDRENVDVIAHELSHSWSGNLVSNASWEHFWLNEGWTTYLERRIQAAVHGEAWRDFSSIIGWKALSDSIAQFGEDHEFTKLIVDLKGKDPDDAFSSIPYEKGFNFLYHIEKLIGKDKFDTFIPHYFTQWKGKSLDSYDFKATLLAFFAADPVAGEQLNKQLDWETWFYKPGFPPKPTFDTSLVDVVYRLADNWESLTTKDPSSAPSPFVPRKSDTAGLSANQLVVFLERVLLFPVALHAPEAHQMGALYGFAESQNVEVASRFCQVAMKARAASILPTVTALLGRVGRMKFVRPLYRGLIKMDRGLAERTFEKNKAFYHPICRGMVEKDLAGKG